MIFHIKMYYSFRFAIENSAVEEEEEFLKEIQMLQRIGVHRNIIRFLGCCTMQRPYFILMEYVGRSDLVKHELCPLSILWFMFTFLYIYRTAIIFAHGAL